MKKTLLDLEIEKEYKMYFAFAKTKAYDAGYRDVFQEGYLKGLKKAKRLVNKQRNLTPLNKEK